MTGRCGKWPTKYGSPKESLVQADIALHYAPWTSAPLSVYGVLGMGSQNTDYTITNGAFADWNGAKSQSGFNYTYGLGTRLFAHRYLSLFAEYRWIPGDLVTETSGVQECWVTYSAGSSYSSCGGGSVPNKSTLLSLGAAIHIR